MTPSTDHAAAVQKRLPLATSNELDLAVRDVAVRAAAAYAGVALQWSGFPALRRYCLGRENWVRSAKMGTIIVMIVIS
jgi:hypothetical protein